MRFILFGSEKRAVWTLAIFASIGAFAIIAVSVGALVASCASARQYAIVADQTFSTAVFALDDAEYQACSSGVLSKAQCDTLNPIIKKALADVQAVTLAIKAMPAAGKVPTSLPDLLQDLNDVTKIVVAFQTVAPDLAMKVGTANDAALKLLKQIAGGG